MRIARVILLVFIWGQIPLGFSGQCPVKDSVLGLIAKIQEPNIDLKKLLPRFLDYVKQNSDCSKSDDSLGSKLLRSTGVVYYKLGELDQAIKYTTQSIELARRIKRRPSLQDSLLLDGYYNLYYYNTLPSQIQSKIEAIDSCLVIDRRLNSDYYITCSLIAYKVEYLLYKGDYAECVKYGELGQAYNAKYATRIKTKVPYYDSITTDFNSFAYRIDGLIFLGDHQQAERLVKDKLFFFKKVNYTYNLGVLYNLFGLVYNLKGDFNTAKNYFIQSCNVNLKEKFAKGYIQSMGKLGVIYNERLNMPDSALWYCKTALKYCDKVDSIYILNLVANAYVRKRDFQHAFQYYNLAYQKLGVGAKISTELVGKLNDEISQKVIEYITGLLMDNGEAKLHEFKSTGSRKSLTEAIEIFIITDHTLSRIKTDYSEPDTKLFWRSHSRRLYEFAIEACYLSGDKQKAFYFLEKSRAVILNEQLNDQRWLNNDQIIAQKNLKSLIENQKKELGKLEQSSSEYLKLQTEIAGNQEKLKSLTQQLRDNNPLYYQSYLDTAIVKISDIQQKILAGRKSLVELFVGDSAVYLMVMSDKDIHFNKLDKLRYEMLLEDLKNGISVPSNSVADINNSIQKCRDLYNLLFKDVTLVSGQVIVSPDAQIFPFEILITNQSGPPRYFIEDYSVSYTYSARYLLNTFTNASNSKADLLGFAPIKFATANTSLAELGGSDKSLKNLGSYFHSADEFTGSAATKSNFLKNFSKYGIIQLYTHASAGSSEPVIYFSDSILYLSDLIPEGKPSTQLIILSACETGKGKVYEGEGTFSFNRAFAAVGIPAAVTTLWSVESESTYQITELFYKYLSEGFPTDVALQKAKLEFLKTSSKEKSMPYFWAGPILSGKAEKIEFSNGNYWKWVGAGIGLFLIVIVFVFIKQRGKSKVS